MTPAHLFWQWTIVAVLAAVVLFWTVLLCLHLPAWSEWRRWWTAFHAAPRLSGTEADVRLPPTWTARAAKGGEWQRRRLDNVIQISERRR